VAEEGGLQAQGGRVVGGRGHRTVEEGEGVVRSAVPRLEAGLGEPGRGREGGIPARGRELALRVVVAAEGDDPLGKKLAVSFVWPVVAPPAAEAEPPASPRSADQARRAAAP